MISKNLDVEFLEVDNVLPHPNADKLEIIHIKGYQAIYTKGQLVPGEKVLYIKSDAQIDLETAWSKGIQNFLGSNGRVKTVKLRGEFSEGIIIPRDKILPFFSWDILTQLSPEDLAKNLSIKHYEVPIPGNSFGPMEAKGKLPYELPPTDQENVQSIDKEYILGKRYLVTRKKDGSSCTITFHRNGPGRDDIEIDVTSRNLNLKLDKDNIWTRAAKPVIEEVMKYIKAFPEFLDNDNIFVLRGEICGQGIQSKAINIDCKDPQEIHIFEGFIQKRPGLLSYHDRKYLPIFPWQNKFLELPNIKLVPHLKVIESLTEQDIQDYLLAPAEEGEGVVLWEIKADPAIIPTGHSFKIRSKEYDAKM